MSIIKDVFNVLNYGALEVLKECNDTEWKSGWVLPKAKKLLEGSFLQELRGTQILGVLAGDENLTERMISELPSLSTKAIDRVSKSLVDHTHYKYPNALGKSVALIAQFNTKGAEIAAANYCAKGSLDIIPPMIKDLDNNKDIIVDLNPALSALQKRFGNMHNVPTDKSLVEIANATNIVSGYVKSRKESLAIGTNIGLD